MKGKVALLVLSVGLVILVGACMGGTGTVMHGSASNTNSVAPNGLTVDNGYPSHIPGAEDVSTMVQGQQFNATPNFYFFESCGRPCWLPLYRSPRLIPGTTATNNFPYERFAGNPGNTLKVVCQMVAGTGLSISQQLAGGYRLQDEHRLPGGGLEASNLWDKVAVPDEALLPAHRPDISDLEATPDGQGHYVWGSDLWFGNTGNHGIPCR